jgi:hypothetical protein
VALSLTVLSMTATLALAQPKDTSANDTNSQDPIYRQSWNYVGSGGTNLGLHSGRNPYAAPVEPQGFNNPGADRSGEQVQSR